MNLPNTLTILRMVLLPLALWLHARQRFDASIAVLIVCFLTDFFDGFLARRLNQITPLGTLLDPVADKFVVLVSFGYLWSLDVAPTWLVALLYARNISQLAAIPVLVWWLKRVFYVKPRWPAKWATATAFVLIPVLLAVGSVAEPDAARPLWLWALIGASVLLEVQVLATYLPRFIQIVRGTHDTFE